MLWRPVYRQALRVRCLSSSPRGGFKLMPMPRFSPSVKKARLIKWHLQVGDAVECYDLAFDAEVEQLSPDLPGPIQLEVELQEEGFLARILVPEGGQPTPVNRPVAVVCEDEDDVHLFRGEAGDKLLLDVSWDLENASPPFLWQAYVKKQPQ